MENTRLAIKNAIQESINVKQKIQENPYIIDQIISVADKISDALLSGNKVMLAGNGGSAADAQHIAAEFVSRLEKDRPGLAAIALTTDTSILTAIGNDYGFENLFKRQIQANHRPGDVLIGITTSGKSKNVLAGFSFARQNGLVTVCLAGEGGDLDGTVDHLIRVPSNVTTRIQESHILIGHIICQQVEVRLFGA